MLIGALLGATSLSLCLAILAGTQLVAVWHLILISLLIGVTTSFNHPARQSIVPNLVKKEHLLNAMALDSMSVRASRIISMPIAGYIIAIVGAWPNFVVRAVGCLLASVWLLLARVPATPPATRTQAPWQNLAEGFRFLRSNALILSLLLLYLMPRIVFNTYMNFLPIFANVDDVSIVGYGYLHAAPGLGAIIALAGLTLLTYYRRRAILLIAAGTILGIALVSFSASPWVFLSLPSLIVIGAMLTAFDTVNSTMIQSVVPDEMRGRVMSWREVALGLGPTGSILFGAIAQYTGVPVSLGLLGGICIIVSLLLIVSLPRFKSIE